MRLACRIHFFRMTFHTKYVKIKKKPKKGLPIKDKRENDVSII